MTQPEVSGHTIPHELCPARDDSGTLFILTSGGGGSTGTSRQRDRPAGQRLRACFLCQLPHAVSSIELAYDALKPQRVQDAEAEGIEVRRQGDVFLIRATERDWNLQLRYGRDTLAKDHRLWGRTHVASKALLADGRVFVSGKLTHERRQHRTVFFKGAWYEAVKNTALASWNAVGYVD